MWKTRWLESGHGELFNHPSSRLVTVLRGHRAVIGCPRRRSWTRFPQRHLLNSLGALGRRSKVPDAPKTWRRRNDVQCVIGGCIKGPLPCRTSALALDYLPLLAVAAGSCEAWVRHPMPPLIRVSRVSRRGNGVNANGART